MRLKITFALLLLLSTLVDEAKSITAEQKVPDYVMKAKIFKLVLDYVRWPPQARMNNRKLIIGIFGNHSFQNQLDIAFGSPQDRVSKSIVFLSSLPKPHEFNVIFVCESELENLYELIQQTRGLPVLIVGDTPGFANRGVMINIVVDQAKLKLEVNLGATKSAGLEIDSNLIKNAKIVD